MLLGQTKRDWIVVYKAGSSEPMDKNTAKDYLEIFDDALYIEKIKGCFIGRKIYK